MKDKIIIVITIISIMFVTGCMTTDRGWNGIMPYNPAIEHLFNPDIHYHSSCNL